MKQNINKNESLLLLEEATNSSKRSDIGRFDNELIPEKIIGATKIDEKIIFLIKSIDSDEYEWVHSHIANIKYPQIVIEFYQQRLKWKNK